MARPFLNDRLQVFPFYLMDIAPIEMLGLPIFTPLFGFSAITAPEVTLETEDIVEGNWFYTSKVVKRASVGTISVSRGATFYDSDFYRWIQAAIHGDTEYFQSRSYGTALGYATGSAIAGGLGGNSTVQNLAGGGGALLGAIGGLFGFPRIGGPSYRRNLLLIQHFARSGGPIGQYVDPPQTAFESTANFVVGAAATVGGSIAGIAASGSIGSAVSLGLQGATGTGPFSGIPARAWMLKGCIPTRYKVGGDFDATSGEVSIMELDFECDFFEEISLAA